MPINAVLDNLFEISPNDIDFRSFSIAITSGLKPTDFADLSNTAIKGQRPLFYTDIGLCHHR